MNRIITPSEISKYIHSISRFNLHCIRCATVCILSEHAYKIGAVRCRMMFGREIIIYKNDVIYVNNLYSNKCTDDKCKAKVNFDEVYHLEGRYYLLDSDERTFRPIKSYPREYMGKISLLCFSFVELPEIGNAVYVKDNRLIYFDNGTIIKNEKGGNSVFKLKRTAIVSIFETNISPDNPHGIIAINSQGRTVPCRVLVPSSNIADEMFYYTAPSFEITLIKNQVHFDATYKSTGGLRTKPAIRAVEEPEQDADN